MGHKCKQLRYQFIAFSSIQTKTCKKPNMISVTWYGESKYVRKSHFVRFDVLSYQTLLFVNHFIFPLSCQKWKKSTFSWWLQPPFKNSISYRLSWSNFFFHKETFYLYFSWCWTKKSHLKFYISVCTRTCTWLHLKNSIILGGLLFHLSVFLEHFSHTLKCFQVSLILSI